MSRSTVSDYIKIILQQKKSKQLSQHEVEIEIFFIYRSLYTVLLILLIALIEGY